MRGMALASVVLLLGGIFSTAPGRAQALSDAQMWMKIRAENKIQRSHLANLGLSLEIFADDYVVAIGTRAQVAQVEREGSLIASFPLHDASLLDFPDQDSKFHNYNELTDFVQTLAKNNPDIVQVDSIGKSSEGRELWHIRLGENTSQADSKPGIVFMGGHHAREHLSVEIPILLAQHLVDQYRKGEQRIQALLKGRDIHIIPSVNPDGAEFDVGDSNYQLWRKNRRNNGDGTYGVDLNRNYGFMWGTGGSSRRTRDETYMGPNAFSEPESQAIRDFVQHQQNLTILLTYHTYSQLILYPWGHVYTPIGVEKDRKVYEAMANKMAGWNKYRPMQASELYVASGDTCDWAYATQKIFAFTFEMDPSGSAWNGFYPGEKVIPGVFDKNLEPALYLMDLADNPYRSVQSEEQDLGFNSRFFKTSSNN